uniref:Uncharacterized protein n=1 Tax=Takifugu rubripes TaxID=31033 RepID=A0A674PK85_TAKRU
MFAPSANLFSSSVLPMAFAAEHICRSTSSRRRMQRMMLPAGHTHTHTRFNICVFSLKKRSNNSRFGSKPLSLPFNPPTCET